MDQKSVTLRKHDIFSFSHLQRLSYVVKMGSGRRQRIGLLTGHLAWLDLYLTLHGWTSREKDINDLPSPHRIYLRSV